MKLKARTFYLANCAFWLAVALFGWKVGHAQVYNYFSPGCALSGTATSQTVNLGTGACVAGNLPPGNLNSGTGASASTFWRGDGTWATPPGTGGGTVNSVTVTAVTPLCSSGSPITNSGTIALSWCTSLTTHQFLGTGTSGTPAMVSITSADLPAINLASSGAGGVVNNLPVTNLNSGTGATGTTFWRGDGSWVNPLLSIVSADIPPINLASSANGGVVNNLPVTNLNSGTGATGTTFWAGDGTWKAVSATAGNPTATVGTSAINGSATTFMRSDAAPAINLTMSPTMTGAWTFSPSAGAGPTINTTASQAALNLNGASASSASIFFGVGGTVGSIVGDSGGANQLVTGSVLGDTVIRSNGGNILFTTNSGSSVVMTLGEANAAPVITAGTPSSGFSLIVQNTSSTNELLVFGDGSVLVGTPTGLNEGSGTVNIATAYYVNGLIQPKTAYASINGVSGCVLSSNQHSGITSCSRSSTGTYTVTIAGGFGSTPTCAIAGGTSIVAYGNAISATSASAATFNSTTGTATDGAFTITCHGN